MTTAIVSNYLRSAFINHVLRNTPLTPPTDVYISLYTSATVQNGTNSGTEVSGGSYARKK